MFVGEDKIGLFGNGKFGVVECFKLPDENVFVAVKRLFSASNKESIILNKFKGFHHIVQLAADEMPNSSLIIMEPLFGGPLNKHIQQGTEDMHISVVLGYMSALLSALSALEKHGCIHRDIKTSNCVLDHDGRLKLCDFGSATLGAFCLPQPRTTTNSLTSESESKRSTYHRALTITGTTHIMAPEMVASDTGYDYSVDYWAVGVFLYELLTGHIPPWKRSEVTDNTSDQQSDWPDEHARYIARIALHIHSGDTLIATEREGGVPAVEATTAEPAAAAAAAEHTPLETPAPSVSQEETEEIASSWSLECLDVGFFVTADTPVDLKNNAQVGEYIVTDTPEEVIRRKHAADLVQLLLTVDPYMRYSALVSCSRNAANGCERSDAESSGSLWSEIIRIHPFLAGVDWESIDNGTAPPPNPNFDKRLGCMELLDQYSGSNDVISDADQDLFAGF